MAVTITVEEVKAMCPTSLPDDAIQRFIGMSKEADACFDSSGVSDVMAKSLKLWGVCHLITVSGGGQVTSERDMDGASVNYESVAGGVGLGSTSFGQLIKSVDQYGCVSSIIDKPQRSAAILNS